MSAIAESNEMLKSWIMLQIEHLSARTCNNKILQYSKKEKETKETKNFIQLVESGMIHWFTLK